jgi:hypothetical protein
MSEFYWITRLDSIVNASELIAVLGVVLSVFAFVLFEINMSDENKKGISFWKKGFIICSFVTLFAGISSIFVPTSKDAMLIFGVGGTIDYIKSNETIKQIPDKCINALDAWVDSLTEKESKNEN